MTPGTNEPAMSIAIPFKSSVYSRDASRGGRTGASRWYSALSRKHAPAEQRKRSTLVRAEPREEEGAEVENASLRSRSATQSAARRCDHTLSVSLCKEARPVRSSWPVRRACWRLYPPRMKGERACAGASARASSRGGRGAASMRLAPLMSNSS
ncbi:MAG: hypothetical protein SGPRY_013084 [Prymnesium sp.]